MLFIVLAISSLALAQLPVKCDLKAELQYLNESFRQTPPDTDTSIVSPNGYFRIHFDTTGTDAPDSFDENLNQIPDYVDEVAVMADSARKVLVDIMGFLPVPDIDEDPYPIYIENRPSGNYGVNTNGGWIEIDNNYSSGFYTLGLQAMRVTVVHEYFHAVQRKYRDLEHENRYFYEFSSTWIEDIIVPDGDDFLFWLEGQNRLWTYPEIAFSETDGYSVALYGHYLNSIIEGLENGMESDLIREIWEKMGNTNLSVSSCINSILDDYQSSFIFSWTDFIARNHFNSRNPEYYYHPDLYDVVPISISASTIYQFWSEPMQLFNNRANLSSFVVYYDGILNIDHQSDNMLGKIVIRGESIEDDIMLEPEELMNIPLFKDVDKMTLIYGSSSNEEIDVEFMLSRKPYPPAILTGYPESGMNVLNWTSSLSSLEILNYYIYRDGAVIDSILDTMYVDAQIESETAYTYHITAVNDNGESNFSNGLILTTWPKNETINKNQIVSVYPSPIRRNQLGELKIILDAKIEYPNSEINVYDILGRQITGINSGFIIQGRQRINLDHLFYGLSISSGWYLLQVQYQKGNTNHIPLIIIK